MTDQIEAPEVSPEQRAAAWATLIGDQHLLLTDPVEHAKKQFDAQWDAQQAEVQELVDGGHLDAGMLRQLKALRADAYAKAFPEPIPQAAVRTFDGLELAELAKPTKKSKVLWTARQAAGENAEHCLAKAAWRAMRGDGALKPTQYSVATGPDDHGMEAVTLSLYE